MKMMMMNRAMVLAAIVTGSFLQGWVFVTLIGSPSCINNEYFEMGAEPIYYAIVVMTLVLGLLLACLFMFYDVIFRHVNRRRPLLVFSSLLLIISSNVMLRSTDPDLLFMARLIDSFGVDFSCTAITLYFRETGIVRGLQVWLPRAANLVGVILCPLVSGTPESLNGPKWRFVFGISLILSILHFVLVIFFLPESPKWFVIEGRIDEAKQALRLLYGPDDVSEREAAYRYPEEIDDKKPAAEQNGSMVDPLLTVCGDGCVREESLTTEEEDRTSNAACLLVVLLVRKSNADASKLTIVTVT